ncbi:MAG: UDP-N-acetylmuramyl-tripeptide synthetase, partial [Myxococcales bacterium]|nr:UDP-N-acetylmuramyl-tripeptide synthetase [Myxococcales bacterium]
GVFTNLTRDHLDYHHTLEAYFDAKERLFTETLAQSPKPSPHAIINLDTPYGARIRVPPNATRLTYGRRGSGADLEHEVVALGLDESVFRFFHGGERVELRLPMLGAFNGANALAAVAIGIAAGGDLRSGVEALRAFPGVPGRVQRIGERNGTAVFVDYAHDPHALEALLPNVREAMQRERPGGRLVTVFGCGGDRDRGKRPLMLRAALRESDRVVVTSDNPRGEDPAAIAAEILTGLPSPSDERVTVELDRRLAIERTLASAAPEDVVLVLGKGHEPYQIVGERRLPYSDLAVIDESLAQRER